VSKSERFILEHYLDIFAALVSTWGDLTKPLRILDFGGGIGNSYFPLINSLRQIPRCEYYIVDSPNNCTVGREVFKHDERVHFSEELPCPKNVSFDIVFSSSTIQYIGDWADVLRRLADYSARYLLLTRLPTTSGKTFVTRQSLTMAYGPAKGTFAGWTYHRFFNRSEIHKVLEHSGYCTLLDVFYSDYSSLVAGLPCDYRDCTLRVMLFEKDIRGQTSSSPKMNH
jgi:putative methyltransferase (TIGR04325 family)